MRIGGFPAVLVSGLSLAGCILNPYPPPYSSSEKLPETAQNIDFVAGCWVAKAGPNGPVTGFLRLLRNAPTHAAYEGKLQSVAGAEILSVRDIRFASDGWSMRIDPPEGYPSGPVGMGSPARRYLPAPEAVLTKLPPAMHRATYNAYSVPTNAWWLVVDGDADALALYVLDAKGDRVATLFDGERDSCDYSGPPKGSR